MISYSDLKQIFSDLEKTPVKTLFVLLLIVALFLFFGSESISKVIYSSQSTKNSPHSVQIQGNWNTVVNTKPYPKPTLTYSFEGLSNRNELRKDGLYHSDIKVDVSFPEKGSAIKYSPNLGCQENYRWNFPVFNTESAIMGPGVMIIYHCASTEPIKEDEGYFLYAKEN
ncbi:MAG: hypothetical protein G01um101417_188 [Parcubacteria group bacterium Gr01-1014_17]|nr:MAG: hypothetical protein G01um101417_188 [Parcubacteria group bacterium Gr01-1014_17]